MKTSRGLVSSKAHELSSHKWKLAIAFSSKAGNAPRVADSKMCLVSRA